MSQNYNDNDTSTTGGGAGGTGSTGTSGGGTIGSGTSSSGGTGSTGLSTTGTGGGSAAGTAPAPSGGAGGGIASQAKEYGQKVADAATKAKDYLSDRASVAGEKIQDLRNVDYGQLANDAKDYARQKPGQALLIAAAAGFVVGILLRGSRR
jgi:ElaB/YqjD/DUF883 family membrane-anchored ribosome-binding protein